MPTNDCHRCFTWNDLVYFTAAEKGDALSIHICAEGREAKRALRQALNEFSEAMFHWFPWCKMIIGAVIPQSVINLGLKCGFEVGARVNGITVMVRKR